MEDHKKLFNIIKYYPYVISVIAAFIFAFIFTNAYFSGAEIVMAILTPILFIVIPIFCLIVLIETIRYAKKYIRSDCAPSLFIELGLSIKRAHKTAFVLFIIIGLIGILTFFLLPATVLVCLYGWFMVVQTGIISSIGIFKLYQAGYLEKKSTCFYIITQFIPFADIHFAKKLLAKIH
ncbi:MAG: hypothetical protein ACI39Q_05505 [Wujia sp.]